MTHDTPAYGPWSLVVLNSLVFIIFAFSFARPDSPRDWRSFGAFAAFIPAFRHKDTVMYRHQGETRSTSWMPG